MEKFNLMYCNKKCIIANLVKPVRVIYTTYIQ